MKQKQQCKGKRRAPKSVLRRVLFRQHQSAHHHRCVFDHLRRQPFVIRGEAQRVRTGSFCSGPPRRGK